MSNNELLDGGELSLKDLSAENLDNKDQSVLLKETKLNEVANLGNQENELLNGIDNQEPIQKKEENVDGKIVNQEEFEKKLTNTTNVFLYFL